MKRFILTGIAAALSAIPLAAQPLTLRSAVDEALSRNPQATASSARRDAAAAQLAEARAGWLPRLDATASSTRSNDPVFVFAALLQQGRFGAAHFDPAFLNAPPVTRSDRATFNARLAVFDQLRRLGSIAVARNGVHAAAAGEEETRQRLRGETIARYYGVAVATARRDVAADAVRTGEGQVRAIRDRHEQGLVVESDLLAAEVQLAAFRQELITAEGELAIARAALAVLLQRPIVEQIGIVEAVPERRFEPAAVDALVARATERRGAAQAAALASRSAALAVRTARGALLPRLDAFASWSSTGPTFRTRDSDRAYGLVASIDLFDGGKYARITAAKAAAAEAEAAAMAASDGVAMEVVTAHARLQSAAERVNVASSAAEQAAAAARIVRDRYENGLTTITEQLRADHALLAARLAFLDARYDYITGYADLLRATGDLTDVDPFV